MEIKMSYITDRNIWYFIHYAEVLSGKHVDLAALCWKGYLTHRRDIMLSQETGVKGLNIGLIMIRIFYLSIFHLFLYYIFHSIIVVGTLAGRLVRKTSIAESKIRSVFIDFFIALSSTVMNAWKQRRACTTC